MEVWIAASALNTFIIPVYRSDHIMVEYSIILLNGATISVKLSKLEFLGGDLLEKVFKQLDLFQDSKYFGLVFSDPDDGRMSWLENSDILNSVKLSKTRTLQFSARFFPEHPEITLTNHNSRLHFCFQLKELLMAGMLCCNVETHAMLDAYLVQAEIGDFDENKHKLGYLKNICGTEICTPTTLNANIDVKEAEYLRMVNYFHRRCTGIRRSAAIIMYLTKAKKLPYFGVTIHGVLDIDGNDLCIELSQRGICMYANSNLNKFLKPYVLEEFSWDKLTYCDSEKQKLRIGFEVDVGSVEELCFKARSYKDSYRLHADILAFRKMFMISEDREFFKTRKSFKRHCERLTRGRNNFQRNFESLTTSVRRSFRKKFSTLKRIASRERIDFTDESNTFGSSRATGSL